MTKIVIDTLEIKNFAEIAKLVPEVTLKYLREKYSR
jgi:citrate lyase synthetase